MYYWLWTKLTLDLDIRYLCFSKRDWLLFIGSIRLEFFPGSKVFRVLRDFFLILMAGRLPVAVFMFD